MLICKSLKSKVLFLIIIIIIIISIVKEDNVFSITASLPYGPPVNTDIASHECNTAVTQYFAKIAFF